MWCAFFWLRICDSLLGLIGSFGWEESLLVVYRISLFRYLGVY